MIGIPGFRDIILSAAIAKGLDPRLVAAVVQVESSFNPWTPRFEPDWRWFVDPAAWAKKTGVTPETERTMQMMSWGLMHVMGAVAREVGFKGALPQLCLPAEGMAWGSAKLKQCVEKFGIPAGLAAYNAGAPDSVKGQTYAAKVVAAWDEIRL